MSKPNQTNTTNLVPVQAVFDTNGIIVSLVGPAGEYFTLPISSDNIVNSTINSSTIGNLVPSSGAFTSLLVSGNTQLQTLSSTATSVNSLTINGTLDVGGSSGTSGQILQSTGTGAQWITANIYGVNITDDTTSSITHYPSLVTNTTGTTTVEYTSSTKLQFTPSTGTLYSTIGSFGTLLTTSATITGGSINSTPIGSTTPSSGAFTTLSTTGLASLFSVSSATITDTSITMGELVFAGTGGLLSGSTNLYWDNTNFRLGIGTSTPTVSLHLNTTDAILVPDGSTAQRPATPSVGMLRYNNTTNQFEGYSGSSPSWFPVGGSVIMKNRFINGAFNVNQYNLGTVTPTGNQYIIDRWLANVSTASKYSVQQSTDAPAGFVNSALITSTSAYTVASGDYQTFQQRIEANNMFDMGWGTANAKTVTLSFWVKSSLTGTFGGSFYFQASTARTYPFSYSIPVANTWTQISITIAGDTFTNTAPTGTSAYVIVQWALGVGTTYSGTAGSWVSGNYASVTGATNLIATSGATFYITGVQLEVGSYATGFEYRQYGQELNLCQRYYWTNTSLIFPVASYSGVFYGQNMRTIPTLGGGGAGFTTVQGTLNGFWAYQTSLAAQSITATAEL